MVEGIAVGAKKLGGALFGLSQQASYLFVDGPLGVVRVGPGGEPRLAEIAGAFGADSDGAEAFGQAPLPHHPGGELGGAGQVVGRAG